jgi:uncharacterized membrane protein YhaH (DUF805 family)
LSRYSGIFTTVATSYGLAVALPGLGVLWRRRHDIHSSGAWFVLVPIPFIGWIWLPILAYLPGTPGPNKVGPDPRAISQYA